MPEHMRALVQQFYETGFLVLPDALDQDTVLRLNRLMDDLMARHPEDWVRLSRSHSQCVDILPRTGGFDDAIENPATLNILRALLGEQITFEELSVILRDPPVEEGQEDIKSWHRDIIRHFDGRMDIQVLSLVYFLTDVTKSDSCFSIIPGSHQERVNLRPEDVTPGMEHDITGPAGTAVIFHARCLHAARLRPTFRQRRSVHIYYGRADQPRSSEWNRIPERLHGKQDPALPPFLYSKWKMKQVVEGTGNKPRDLDPALSSADMVRIVQERANRLKGG